MWKPQKSTEKIELKPSLSKITLMTALNGDALLVLKGEPELGAKCVCVCVSVCGDK